MNRTWKFSDLEFIVLWEFVREDFLPYPFVAVTRGGDDDEFRWRKQELLQRLRATSDPGVFQAMETLARPDISIVVSGNDPRNATDPAGLTRVIGARKGEHGCVVTELPGESFWYSGGFMITECSAVALADKIVAALPAAEPGRMSDVILDRDASMDYWYGQSNVRVSFEDSVAERADRFLNAPAISTGELTVFQDRSIFGPRGRTTHQLRWHDLDGDGRYVINDASPPMAVPADAKRFVQLINTRIAEVVRAIKDEHA